MCVELGEISEGLTLREWTFDYQTLFRARIGSYDNLPDLLYPPSHQVRRYGRLNSIGESMFYCSARKDISILEIHPSVGDLVTVLELSVELIRAFAVGMDICSLVGNHPKDFRHALQGRIDFYRSSETLFDMLKTDMANAYFHRLITAPASPIGFRITGVFSKHLFKNCDGLWYPNSVSTNLAMRFGAANLALKPEFIDRHAKFISLKTYKVIKQIGDETLLRCIKSNKLA